MGETTHQIGAKRLTGETTQGETTQGETTHGRNDSRAKQLTGETTRDHFKVSLHKTIGNFLSF